MDILIHPNKKIVFWFLTIINLMASIADLGITYIGTPDLSREGNPLVYTFSLGWNSLIITSVIVFIVIVVLLYYAFFQFKRVVVQCEGFRQYMSMVFFNRPDKFIWTLYKFPKNKIGWSYFAASLGLGLALVIPIGHLFAIILWIGIINDLNFVHIYHNLFNIIITPIGRTDTLIGGVILFLFIYYYWFSKEYKINKKILENGLMK